MSPLIYGLFARSPRLPVLYTCLRRNSDRQAQTGYAKK